MESKTASRMDHIKDITNKMRELATNPTTAFASQPDFSATNNPTSCDTANVNDASKTDAPISEADANSGASAYTDPNANINTDSHADTRADTHTEAASSSSSSTKFKPPTRTEYHVHLSKVILHRLSSLSVELKSPLGLTDDYAIRLTNRTLEEMVHLCKTIAASTGISQGKEITYLEQKMKEVEAMKLVGAIRVGAEEIKGQTGLRD